MIYQVTHADSTGKGSVEPDDMTGLELVDVNAFTDAYVPVGGSAGEPHLAFLLELDDSISVWDEDTTSWVEVE